MYPTMLRSEYCGYHVFHRVCIGSAGDAWLRCVICRYILPILMEDETGHGWVRRALAKGEVTGA